MNRNGQQTRTVGVNNTQTQNGQYPSYVPSNDGMNLFNSKPEDIGFEHDPATGQLTMTFKPKQTQQGNANANTQNQNNSQPNNSQNNNQNQSNGYDEKFAAIDNQFQMMQGALTKLAGFLDGMSRNQHQPNQQQQERQIELNVQSEDFVQNLLTVLNNSLDARFKSFEEKFAPIQQTTSQMQERMTAADLAMKYGSRFTELFPIMMEMKKSDPALANASWEVLYNNLSKHIPQNNNNSQNQQQQNQDQNGRLQDSTVRTDNGNQNQVQPQSVNMQNLQQRADQLATENGGVPRSIVNEQQKHNSIESAFEAAVAEHYGQRT